jgi:hypothetical protein
MNIWPNVSDWERIRREKLSFIKRLKVKDAMK